MTADRATAAAVDLVRHRAAEEGPVPMTDALLGWGAPV